MGKEESIVRRLLGSDRVKRVKVVSDVNIDGEKILRLYVVYDSSKGLSVEEMSSITDEIWSENLKRDDPAYLVPSFVSSDDEKVLGAAQ